MNNETNFSLIDFALTEMAAKQNSPARLAELAQRQNHARAR